jgi:hypothetical protein
MTRHGLLFLNLSEEYDEIVEKLDKIIALLEEEHNEKEGE